RVSGSAVEEGVGSWGVTGVETGAVPVGKAGVSLMPSKTAPVSGTVSAGLAIVSVGASGVTVSAMSCAAEVAVPLLAVTISVALRSEERRVGQEGRRGGAARRRTVSGSGA